MNLLKYKAVIFDLDGTLINSLEDLADCVNAGLRAYNLPEHEVGAYKKMVGNGRRMLISRAIGEAVSNGPQKDELIEEVTEIFNREYNKKFCEKTKPYDGIADMLKKLKNSGAILAVLSNKPDSFVLPIINKLLPNTLDRLYGKKPEFPEKPDPASLSALLDELKLQKSDCVYIGDSDVDVITAKNANVDFCGVSWGFRGREELVKCGASIVVDTPEELTAWLINN